MSLSRGRPTQRLVWWCVGWTVAAVSGCTETKTEAPQTPPVEVTVAAPLRREVTDYVEFTGRTAAVQQVEIRARVTGYLWDPRDLSEEERTKLEELGYLVPWKKGVAPDKDKYLLFQEGDEVRKNQLLFLIDPRPYQAQYDQALAQVELRKANQELQETELKRNKPLFEKGAISASDFDKVVASAKEAKAAVAASESSLEGLDLNLQFTRVVSPIDGVISGALVTPGNLVTADSTLLTNVVSIDPMYAYFDMDELTVLRLKQLVREGKLGSRKEIPEPPVQLALADETEFKHTGIVDFIDNKLDAATGTIKVRGVFPNPVGDGHQRPLTAEQFVRVRVPLGDPQVAVLVAEQAIGSEQGRKYVWVVGAGDQVEEKRFVTLGRLERGLRVVDSGLNGDERVVVEGVQRVRKGRPVKPETAPMDRFQTAAPAKSVPSADKPAAKATPDAAPKAAPRKSAGEF